MRTNEDETWDDLDIKDNSFLYHTSRGIYSYYPDKDLARACQRLLSPSISDDDDTVSTTTSIFSDKFSVDEQDLSFSDFQHSPEPSSSTSSYVGLPIPQQQASTIHSVSSRQPNNNNKLSELLKGYDGPGTITRLGHPGGRVHTDNGDWTEDLDLPTALKLPSANSPSKNSNESTRNQATSSLDDDGDDDPFADLLDDTDNNESTGQTTTGKKSVRFDDRSLATTNKSSSSTSLYQPAWKEEEDDEGFDDIDIPKNIGSLTIKSQHNQPTINTMGSNSNTSKKKPTLMTPLPSAIQKHLIQFKEKDEDDFMNGLDIKDGDIFKTITSSKKEKQTIESKLPRPKQYQHKLPPSSFNSSCSSSSPASNKKVAYENRLNRLTAPTYASRQRGTNNTSTPTTPTTSSSTLRSRQSNTHLHHDYTATSTKTPTTPRPTFSRRPYSTNNNSSNTNKKSKGTVTFLRSGDGSTLITRPRSAHRIIYGNGSELDHLDDLADWKRPSFTSRITTAPSTGGKRSAFLDQPVNKKPEPSKPWRCNMSKRKMTLIKPNERNVAKEINDMKYDEREKRWQGNEQAIQSFDAPAKRRPALVKSMTQSRTAKSTMAMVVGNMTFDHQRMTWTTRNSADEENVLAHIADLTDNIEQQQQKRPSLTTSISTTEDFSKTILPATSIHNTRHHSSAIHSDDNIRLDNSNNSFPSSTSSSSSSSSLLAPVTRSLSSTCITNTIPSPTETTTTAFKHSSLHYRHDHHSSVTSLSGTSEFNLPVDIQRAMRDQEEDHNTFLQAWPLRNECEMTTTSFGHDVPQHTYILY
ncbi:uncharacterized protein BX664DRAFT_357110 [Halteromyces radiatus]|uniref:uncharacterized protein n=1 Tax=Halteromyces radiatus TaxID=101107 RepID=UPI00221F8DEF|nr:uncharacterized protein BX664DRAFT_357110 [Halteromyces radiatus]KAI8092581.1 hypothetical protein BX664DRAFT_357110 [Halteromyces radiatus]